MNPPLVHVKPLQCQNYHTTVQAMRAFTNARTADTPDEIWCIEHPPVYTLGQAANPEHLLNPGDIPVETSDRGGQVTYHGPGQLLMYTLLDLRRLKLDVRSLVSVLETSVIQLLSRYAIAAEACKTAPGVYVKAAKIAAIGLRIRRGYCYHGLALNVAMNLQPFSGINPCGFSQLAITQLADLGGPTDITLVAVELTNQLKTLLAIS